MIIIKTIMKEMKEVKINSKKITKESSIMHFKIGNWDN